VLETFVRLPYLLVIMLLNRLVKPYSPLTLKAAVASAQCVIYLLGEATIVGMPALAYKRIAVEPSQFSTVRPYRFFEENINCD
jgi:hypothetical protein